MMLKHDFIQSYVGYNEDENNYYLFTQYVNGMNLFSFLRELSKIINVQESSPLEYVMELKTARFYMAQIILIIEFLHSKQIIYRDLKPENLMLDEEGYLKLIDFGTSKRLEKDKTFTLMGSLHYIAPEVLDGRGHDYPADIFSIGVIFFELICGSLPFGDDEEDPVQVYERIMTQKVSFPDHINQPSLKKLIRQLMRKNPLKRKRYTFQFIKDHEVFQGINWVSRFCHIIHDLLLTTILLEIIIKEEVLPAAQPKDAGRDNHQ